MTLIPLILYKGKVKNLMEMFGGQRLPEIEEVRYEDEVLRILLGSNSQLAHTWRDLSAVYGGLNQVWFMNHNDDEIDVMSKEVRTLLREAGYKVMVSINILREAFDRRLKVRPEVKKRREPTDPTDRRGYA